MLRMTACGPARQGWRRAGAAVIAVRAGQMTWQIAAFLALEVGRDKRGQ
ncbi:hypothetical protein MPC1_7920003 [Methylocella tundrae]|nr:hypothetical protein MPC1_7920003 [Methylocella tundrae]